VSRNDGSGEANLLYLPSSTNSLPLDGEGAECNEADEVRQINRKYISIINPPHPSLPTANPPSPPRGRLIFQSVSYIHF